MLHASIIWRKEWGWGDQAEQLLITETNFNKHKQFEQTYIISSSPCRLDSLYFMQDRICWTNWLQLFIQSTHAWLTLFYAGQNLLNQLTAAFHPVHARLTHSILCRTEFAERFVSAAFVPLAASPSLRLWVLYDPKFLLWEGTVWVFLSCLWVFLSYLQHHLTILQAYCHDGIFFIITL